MCLIICLINRQFGVYTIPPAVQMIPSELRRVDEPQAVMVLHNGSLDLAHYSNGSVTVYDSAGRSFLNQHELLVLRSLFRANTPLSIPRMAQLQNNDIDCGVLFWLIVQRLF